MSIFIIFIVSIILIGLNKAFDKIEDKQDVIIAKLNQLLGDSQ